MRQFQERKNIRRKMYSKPVLIGMFVLCLILIKAVVNIYLKYRLSIVEKEVLEVKLLELKEREHVLESDIKNLESEDGLESEFRKKFNVAKPQEQLIVVLPDEEKVEEVETESFFKRMFRSVGSWFGIGH